MREETHTIKIYKFDELPEKGKQKALEKLYDLNVDYEWWQSTYEDAARVGLKITEFDADRYCKGRLTMSAKESAEAILKEHGDKCETFATATALLSEWPKDEDESEEADDMREKLEEDYENALLEDYRIILRNEYEYLTEAIVDNIYANDYEFTEDGRIY